MHLNKSNNITVCDEHIKNPGLPISSEFYALLLTTFYRHHLKKALLNKCRFNPEVS